MLQRILRGRLTFTLRRNEVSGEIDGYEFEGETRYDQLFSGIAVERPKHLDPHDLAGTEEIGPEETGEPDFGRLLERAYEKNHVGGSTSPTAVAPFPQVVGRVVLPEQPEVMDSHPLRSFH